MPKLVDVTPQSNKHKLSRESVKSNQSDASHHSRISKDSKNNMADHGEGKLNNDSSDSKKDISSNQ